MSNNTNQLPDHPESRCEEYLAVMAGQAGATKPNHPSSRMEQYLDYLCDNGGGGVNSVNGKTGTVVLDAEDVGAPNATDVELRSATLTAWNQDILAGSVTPNVTLPAPSGTKAEAITYIFTAASANASFTAPANWKLCDEDGTSSLSTGNTISYTDLTTGSIYEVSFKPISSSVIRMVMLETKTA